MKTYLLSFITSDFSKNGKVWNSEAIDLYANKFYTNYSYTRSPDGLNLLPNFVFTGTEILEGATPTIPGAFQVTNYRRINNRSQLQSVLHI